MVTPLPTFSTVTAFVVFCSGLCSAQAQSGLPVFSTGPTRVAEGNSRTISARVPVYLSTAASESVAVSWTTADGTAVAGADFTASGGTVTFAPGETAKSVVVLVKGDTIDEDNETFSVNFSNPVGTVLADTSERVLIHEDEVLTTVQLPSSAYLLEKGQPRYPGVPQLKVGNARTGRTAAYHLTGEGAAEAGTDLAVPATPVDLNAAGIPLPLTVIDDEQEEADEIFQLSVVSAGPRVQALPSKLEETLPATLPPVSMAVEEDVLVTGDGVDLKIRRRGAGGFVEEAVMPGAAEGGVFSVALENGVIAADFRNTGVKIFTKQTAGWTVEAVIPLPVPPTGVMRPLALQDGTLVIGQPAAAAGAQGGSVSGSVRIHERHIGGRGAWGARQVPAPEAGQPDFGTALSLWGDFILAGAPGSFAVTLFQRTGPERNWSVVKEYVRFVPGFGTSFSLCGDLAVMYQDGKVVRSFRSAGDSGTWGDFAIYGHPWKNADLPLQFAGNVLLELSEDPTEGDHQLRFRTQPSFDDGGMVIYGRQKLPVPRRVAFDGKTLVVTGDGTAQAAGLLVFRDSASVLTLLDDDSLRVSVDSGEVWAGGPRVGVNLSRALPVEISADLTGIDGTAISGDYFLSFQRCNFPPGTTRQTYEVGISPPLPDEVAEQFFLRPEPGFGKPGPDAVMTIVQNPGWPTISFKTPAPGTVEGHSGITTVAVPYVLSGPAPEGASFQWEATAISAEEGSDYSVDPGTVTIPTGAVEGSIPVRIHGDTQVEPEETFVVYLYNPVKLVGSQTQVTLTISADDFGTARDDAYTMVQGSVLQGSDVRSNDTGITLIRRLDGLMAGSLRLNQTAGEWGTFTYTPPYNFIGQDQFTYSDAYGALGFPQSKAVVKITVTDGLRPPQLQDDSYNIAEDSVLDLPLLAWTWNLLANDRLYDAQRVAYDAILEMDYSEVVGGVLSNTQTGFGGFKFTPWPDFSGWAGFRYRVRDKDGWSLPAKVTINVKSDLPVEELARMEPAGTQLYRSQATAITFPAGKVDALLDLRAGQTLSLRAELTSGTFRSLEVSNAAGGILTGGVSGNNSLEHLPIPADGRYKITVGGTSAAIGDLTVLVNGGLPYRPRSIATAYLLDQARPAGSPRAAVYAKMPNEQPHYYAFAGVAGEAVELVMQSSEVQRFSLRSASDAVLANSEVNPAHGMAASLRFTPSTSGTIYARVSGLFEASDHTLFLYRAGDTHETASPGVPQLTTRNTGYLSGPAVAPAGSPPATFTFAAFGSSGPAVPSQAFMSRMVKSWNPGFIISAGNHNRFMEYDIGDSTWKTNVGNFYGEFIKGRDDQRYPEQTSAIPRFFPVPGSADSGPGIENGGELSAYLDYFHSNPGGQPRLSLGIHQPLLSYYKMSWANAEFFFLDSDMGSQETTAHQVQRQWLKEQISLSTARWKFGVWHHSPFSSSANPTASSYPAQWVPDFEGLTAIITGQEHLYERLNIGQGVTQFTVGTAGSSLHPIQSNAVQGSTFRYNNNYGGLKVTGGEEGVRFDFCGWGLNGGNLVDSFVIGTPPTPACPSGMDTWALRVHPGESLKLTTRTPSVPGGLLHNLRMKLQVMDAGGALVASSVADAANGRDTTVHFTVPAIPGAPPEGVLWTVKILNDSTDHGEYEILTSPSPLPLYDAWARENLPALPALPDEDPDHDGAPNLMEFLMDSDPRIPSPGTPVTPLSAAGTVQLRLNLPADWTRPVGVILQSSANLTDSPWTALATKSAGGAWTAVAPGIFLPVPDPAGGFRFTPVPQGRQFYRLAFELE